MAEADRLLPATLPSAGQHGEVITRRRDEFEAVLREAKERGVELGVKNERAATRKTLDALGEAHLGELKRLSGEIVHREAAAHAHGFHKAGWMFGFSGFALGIVLTLLGGLVWLRIGTEATVSGVAAGSMARDQERNVDALERLRTGEP